MNYKSNYLLFSKHSRGFSIQLHKIENIEGGNLRSVDEFTILFRKYYEALYFFAGRFVKDASSAENIVQDVFVNLWENRGSININTSAKSYLYTSVKNSCLNFLKRENFFDSTDETAEYADKTGSIPHEKIEADEIKIEVNKTIARLPQKCREIFLMARFDDLSYAEIAEIQNISINTVKTQLKRAMKFLSENLKHLKSYIIFIQFMIWWYSGK